MNAAYANARSPQYELRFHPLGKSHRAFAFRCDASGQVDLDRLSSRERDNYLYARVTMGREFTWPSVEITDHFEAR
jgi:hypothetical protein